MEFTEKIIDLISDYLKIDPILTGIILLVSIVYLFFGKDLKNIKTMDKTKRSILINALLGIFILLIVYIVYKLELMPASNR